MGRIIGVLLCLCLGAWEGVAAGQTTTGQIGGAVTDQSRDVLVGATVTLQHEGTREERTAVTNDQGQFAFPALVPGTYKVTVSLEGFRTYEQTGIVLTANERRSLGALALELGSLTENVSIAASNVAVQTGSSENSELLTSQQLNQLVARGRDLVGMLRVLPGVTQGTEGDALGGTFGTTTPNIGGTRNRMNTISLDGQTGSDADQVDVFNGSTSIDAIAEVKVLVNNYQAEYGRNAGAVVNIVSKSGGRDYKGSGYLYKRHESLNATDFFNNRNGQLKPLYRYTTLGGTLGGPIYLPGKFNANRDKLFFFYSREDWRIKEPRAVRRVTVPTALERQGDFSQTLDLNGRLIAVIDPQTGQPFPGNRIPANRLDANGQALLDLFPLPNITDRGITGGNYNYQFQEITDHPKKQNLLKVDYHPTSADHLSVRGRTWWADRRGYEGLAAFNSNWDQLYHHYLFKEDSIQASYTKIFGSSVVNEFAASFRTLDEDGAATAGDTFDPVSRAASGLSGLGQLNPQLNPLGIIPQGNYGGVPNAANVLYDGRLPIAAGDERYTLLNNLTVSKGGHAYKFGFYFEYNKGTEGPRGNFGGRFDFDQDTNNPFDSRYAYANAVLGNFRRYTESTSRTATRNTHTLVEWFAQDTWRATRKLTLDYGLRFSWATPWQFPDGDAAAFVLERYDAAQAPVLYRPARNPAGARVGQNPLTGEFVPAVLIGAYVPGTGNPINGMVRASDDSYPGGFLEQQPVQVGPRLGFSYDPWGDGRTAVRGGFGLTYNMVPSNGSFANPTNSNPPNQFNPEIYYGSIATYRGSSGVLFPNNVTGFERDMKFPRLASWSFGVQRDIGKGVSVDLTYAGNSGKYLSQQRDLNTIPYGARFDPTNADPTNPAVPLPDNFLRPLPGFGAVQYRENSGISNYHALQTSINRRYLKGLAFGMAYTWSKAFDYSSGDNGQLPRFRPDDVWLYGLASFDQTHVVVFNYSYDLPKLSTRLPNPVVKWVFDDWQLSGITTFASGNPLGFSYSTVDNADITGGGDGGRLNIVGDLELARGDRSFDRWFNTAAVARPARGDFGNASRAPLRGPGIHNWDMSLVKYIPLGSAARTMQFRWEVYNLFNHTQFASVNTAARFDAAGNQVNTQFGQITATRAPRIMQASVRIQF
jgi:hypothetical protein